VLESDSHEISEASLEEFRSALPDSLHSWRARAQWQAFQSQPPGPSWPLWRSARLSPDGKLWTQEYVPDGSTGIWRVRAIDGTIRQTVLLQPDEVLLDILDGRVLTWSSGAGEVRLSSITEPR
jgi:hypothetical protein